MFKWLNRKMRRTIIARYRRAVRRNKPIERKEPVLGLPKSLGNIARSTDQDIKERLASILAPYKAPEGVVPKGYSSQMAMDSAPNSVVNWAFLNAGAAAISGWLADGLGFMSYAYTAEMMQRAEFRKPVEVIARESVREWIEFHSAEGSSGSEKENVTRKIKELEAAFKKFKVREIAHDALYGGLSAGLSHVWFDIKGVPLTTEGQNLPLILENHSDLKGRLRGFKVIEAVWTTPNFYNADTPLKDSYYKVENWWVQGSLIHKDRLFQVIPYPVRQLLQPAFNMGGQCLPQLMRADVHNYLRTRNSVANIASNFSKLVLKSNAWGNLQEAASGGVQSLLGRATILRDVSEGQDTFVIDKEQEDVDIVSTPLSGLHELQAQAMEGMARFPGIPFVKLFGIQPTGLNASSDGEIRVFYDEIASTQQRILRPLIERMLKAIQLHLWGEIDPSIDFRFKPLWQNDDRTKAEIEKLKAEADAINIEAGIITPEEARQRQNADADSLYNGIDLSGLPPEKPSFEDDDDLDQFDPIHHLGSDSSVDDEPRDENGRWTKGGASSNNPKSEPSSPLNSYSSLEEKHKGLLDKLEKEDGYRPHAVGDIDHPSRDGSRLPILLRKGEQDYSSPNGKGWGLSHIEFRHGNEIQERGHKDVPSYVKHVVKNYSLDKLDRVHGSRVLAVEPEKKSSNSKADMSAINLVDNGSHYSVHTSYPLRWRGLKKM